MNRRSPIQGLREGVRRFFAFEADRILVARPAGGPAVAAKAAPPAAPVCAGRFGLIGLSELRESVGPRWPALEGRVRALAEAVISRHLTAGDVFEVQEDGSYVVLFARLEQDAADFKCRVIGREITEKLLGSDCPRLADVESVSAQVSREALATADIDAALADAFAAGEVSVSSDPASPRPQSSRPRLRRKEPRWEPLPPDGDARPRSTRRRVDREGGAPHAPAWRDTDHPGHNSPVGAPIAHDPAHQIELARRYTPVWDFRKMSLVRFRLAARGTAETGADGGAAADGARFEADVGALRRALEDLSKLTSGGRRLLVVCSVHESSLGVQWRRDQLLELLREARPQVRRLLSVEIFSPEYVASLAVARFVEASDALGVECGACVPLGSTQPVRPAGTPLKTAAVDAPEGLSQTQALMALNTFSRRCAQVGLESAAHGLGTRSLVIGAIAAGIRFLSGEAVHHDINDLSNGLRFEPTDLYRDLLVGRTA